MKVAILGEKKSVLAFKALGAETFGIANPKDLELALGIIEEMDCAILFITEDIAQQYEQTLSPFYNRTLPAVLVVPCLKRREEKRREGLKKVLERALGSARVSI